MACNTLEVGEHEENTSQIEAEIETTAAPVAATETSTIPCSEPTAEPAVEPTIEPTTTEPAVETEATSEVEEYIRYYTDEDAVCIAKVLLKECGGISSNTEKACVVWCILNRVDNSGSSIYDVASAQNQFAFYESTDVRDDLLELAYDVLQRWNDERNSASDVGRVLPAEYMWFRGDGEHNYFRNAFSGDYMIWDYSLSSPYEN